LTKGYFCTSLRFPDYRPVLFSIYIDMYKTRTAFISLIILLLISPVWGKAQQKRIISLAPSLTKNIYFLEAQNQLVGCTSYCTEALADNKEVVASAIKVNLEKAVSLKPDLVLVTTMTEPETIEMLEKFDIQVEVFSTPKDKEEVFEQFLQIGSLVNKKEKANDIVATSKQRIKEIKELLPAHNKDIFFQIGAQPIFSVLPGTFMNDYITILGGRNIATDVSTGAVTRESVVAKNPDIIFVVTMGITGEEECKEWQTFKGMKATDNDKIYIIDAEKACSPTPVTFVETLDTLVSLFKTGI
jgi:ABC-type Fe3+-hydroxamate transport system substrate-binding protein